MASEKILMPQLGESVTEGTISKWLVNVGDKIKKYDPIAEVMTDKVNAEVPSSFTGTMLELVAEESDTVGVGELIAYMEVEAKETSKHKKESGSDNMKTEVNAKTDDKSMKKRYSPAVLRLAQENDIDLAQVEGSGRGGRITRKDIQQLIASGDVLQPSKADQHPSELSETIQPKASSQMPIAKKNEVDEKRNPNGDIEIPVIGVRKAIADNMVRSKHEVPHAWTMVEVDVTSLVNLRNIAKAEFKKNKGYSLTFLPFFIKAVVEALQEFPQINAMWAGDRIIRKKDINISVAVGNEEALYVPVIKHADEKNIQGLAKKINEFVQKVRTGSLDNEDSHGGTFTVNNTGSFGSIMSAPVINYPQAAILSVESIVKRPVVMNDDMIAVRDMVNLCLSLDHRILDGLTVGRFLQSVKQKLENISEENTSIY